MGACVSVYVLISVFAILISVGCTDPFFVRNNQGDSVPAALDIQSCEVLAMNEFESPSDDIRAAYDIAKQQGQIVLLKNDTNVEQSEVLNFENKHLVPWTPTGPITVAEEHRHHIGVYEWMIPKEGPYKGRSVCVSISMRYGKYPPL